MFELEKNIVNMVTIKWYMDNLKDKIILSATEIQRLLDYKEKDLVQVISDIIDGYKIGNITITDKNELMDGYKRINAINSFIDGDIKYNGKNYSELSSGEKELFDKYHIGVFVSSIGDNNMIKFKVTDNKGNDVTSKNNWYLNSDGELFFETNDIDSPLMEATEFTYEVIAQ